jgi:hypothetical protein
MSYKAIKIGDVVSIHPSSAYFDYEHMGPDLINPRYTRGVVMGFFGTGSVEVRWDNMVVNGYAPEDLMHNPRTKMSFSKPKQLGSGSMTTEIIDNMYTHQQAKGCYKNVLSDEAMNSFSKFSRLQRGKYLPLYCTYAGLRPNGTYPDESGEDNNHV